MQNNKVASAHIDAHVKAHNLLLYNIHIDAHVNGALCKKCAQFFEELGGA